MKGVGRVVNVGIGQRAGVGYLATAGAIVGYLHVTARRTGDHRGVVGAVDRDGDGLLAVPSMVVTVKVSVRGVLPTLSACTAALVLSSV